MSDVIIRELSDLFGYSNDLYTDLRYSGKYLHTFLFLKAVMRTRALIPSQSETSQVGRPRVLVVRGRCNFNSD